MRYTDIAWDFDGTLFDSYPDCVREFQECLRKHGHEESAEEIMETMTVTLRYAREYFEKKCGLKPGILKGECKAFSSFRPETVKPYPGIEAVLKAIKDSGRRNILYTNRNHTADQYLEHYGLTKYFAAVITQKEMPVMKPDPSGAYMIRDMFNIAPGKLLMVGDREADIAAVKPAGFDGCFYNTNHIEPPGGVDYVLEIDELEKLLDII